jgi:pimeloyl-ACP methyl ester carboxylesterase
MLTDAVKGERFRFGGISAYVAGRGAPLVLVHSVNAAASVAEVRPLFEHFAKTRQVFALDLPGFGHSERGARDYTPRLMTDALHALVAQMRARGVQGPVDALAVSLGCEFLARAAGERPADWGRIALVSPTGMNGLAPRRGAAGSTRQVPAMLGILSVPLWSGGLFNTLTRPGVVRFFLEKTWGSKSIDEAAWDYAVRTAREPGARFAPLAFLSGKLFSADVTSVYEALAQPVWMSHGVRGDFTDYRGKALFEGRPNWRVTVYPTGALPYFERPGEFIADFEAFLATPR